MSNLQTLSQPLNQTSFARAVRLGVESALDAVATVDRQRADNIEMALRWYHAAEKYADTDAEVVVLNGFGDMLRAFNVYV